MRDKEGASFTICIYNSLSRFSLGSHSPLFLSQNAVNALSDLRAVAGTAAQ
jgi:hypothetical protein